MVIESPRSGRGPGPAGPSAVLELLSALLDYCSAREIEIFMVGDGVLGAVRDQALHPGTARLELALLRADYKRLLSALAAQPLPGTVMQVWRDARGYRRPFARLRNKAPAGAEGKQPAPCLALLPFDPLPRSAPLRVVQRALVGLVERSGRPRRLGGLREALVRLPGAPKGGRVGCLARQQRRAPSLTVDDLLPTRLERLGPLLVPIPGNCEVYLDQRYPGWR